MTKTAPCIGKQRCYRPATRDLVTDPQLIPPPVNAKLAAVRFGNEYIGLDDHRRRLERFSAALSVIPPANGQGD
jgi:hypothetical protein